MTIFQKLTLDTDFRRVITPTTPVDSPLQPPAPSARHAHSHFTHPHFPSPLIVQLPRDIMAQPSPNPQTHRKTP